MITPGISAVIVVADTSAVFAAFDRSQADHTAAREVLQRELLVLSPLVLTELDHLMQRDFGFSSSVSAMDALVARLEDGQCRLADLSVDDLVRAQQVRATYESLHLDLADGIAVVLADRYGTNVIFTLDHRDLRAVKPLRRFAAFRLLPADLFEA